MTLSSTQGSEGWVGIDLDRTIAKYDTWRGELHIGEPLLPMVERVKAMLAAGERVKIFTARVSDPDSDEVRQVIEDWTEKHLGQRLEVTCVKDYHMVRLYDDRAVQVEANTGYLKYAQED